jgi:hypothetical protein
MPQKLKNYLRFLLGYPSPNEFFVMNFHNLVIEKIGNFGLLM